MLLAVLPYPLSTALTPVDSMASNTWADGKAVSIIIELTSFNICILDFGIPILQRFSAILE